MRTFILMALKGRTSPDFSLDKLKEAGRMDLICRTISSAIWISNDLRRDTNIHVVMTGPKNPPKTISFYGAELKGIEPDERTIARKIQEALKIGLNLKTGEEKQVSPGVKVSKKGFETLVKETQGQIIYLHKEGKDIRKFKFEKDITFILGDYIGLPKKTEIFLDRLNAERINLGPRMLFASHCPIIVHNEIDRKEN